jgi:hypothetical protein
LQLKHPKIFENDKNPLPRCLTNVPASPALTQQLNRHHSSESINSVNSMFSQQSFQSSHTAGLNQTATLDTTSSDTHNPFSKSSNKKMGWIRSSFSKAFSRKNSHHHGHHQSNSQQIKQLATAVPGNKVNDTSVGNNSGSSSSSSSSDVLLAANIASSHRKYVCLSDVDENEYLSSNNSGKSSKNSNEIDDLMPGGGGLSHTLNRASMSFRSGVHGGEFSLPSSPLHNAVFQQQSNYHHSMSANNQ